MSAAVAAVLLGFPGIQHNDDSQVNPVAGGASLATIAPPPESFGQLADLADLVATGTVTKVVREADEGAYDASGLPSLAPGSPSFPSHHFTYYEVRIDEVIATREGLQRGDSISLRVSGSYAEPSFNALGKRMPEVGDRRLFLVTLTPDGAAYGPNVGSILDISGPTPRFDWI